jgi:mitogen-activated protein kinase organizer 1
MASCVRSCAQTIANFKDSVSSMQIYDHEVLTGSVDGRIRLFDLRMGARAACSFVVSRG